MILKILRIATVVAALGVVIVTLVWWLWPPVNIEEKRLYVDAYRAIGIGFLVALIGTIIPNLILESRDNFERAKQSRIAYSEAKTSVIYLPGTLAVQKYGEAMAALQKSHRKLHIAETYGKELDEYLEWYGDKEIWSEQIYLELTVVRTLLQSHADQWQDQSIGIGRRTIMVDQALMAVRDMFGTKGEKWKKLSEKDREKQASEIVKSFSRSDAARELDRMSELHRLIEGDLCLQGIAVDLQPGIVTISIGGSRFKHRIDKERLSSSDILAYAQEIVDEWEAQR